MDLIGKRHAVGVNVADLARDKAVDLREFSACWLSRFVHRPDLHFSRILCFEPARKGRAPEVAGDLFRSITSRRPRAPSRLATIVNLPLAFDRCYARSTMHATAEHARDALYLYIDEAGNFDFGHTGTRHFVLTGVLMRRPFTHLEGLLDVKYDVLEEGLDLSRRTAAVCECSASSPTLCPCAAVELRCARR